MNHPSLTKWSARVAGAALLAASLTALPLPSQAADPAVVQQAQDSCVQQAQQKGFTLKKVVYAGAADVAGKDAKIVLNLLRDGGLFKLTCYYDKTAGATFGDSDITEVRNNFPWWWMLLPILGLPLLLAWAKGRDRTVAETRRHINYYDAVIRGGEDDIPVYSEPSLASRIVGYVHNGQAVRITDRDVYGSNVGDWVELSTGGWIPKQYIGTTTRI